MSTTEKNISHAAARLREAAATGSPCAPIRDLLNDGDIAAAYAVQEINTKQAIVDGRRLVGRKIGLTSLAVQKQLGVDQPDYGMLFADMAVLDGFDVPVGRLIQPKVEAEIAFILGRDLDDERLTVADVIRAVEYVVPAIEIVDSRVKDWDIRILDTIADNASSGLYVLGSQCKRLTDVDLVRCGMVLECSGEPVSTGAGAACLGNPLNATTWLASKMAKVGRPLKAGDTVLSGALGPMVVAKPGDVFETHISGLGSVRAVFSKE